MTKVDPKNLEEMKRFIFQELADGEREILEGRFFVEEDFFYDLMELENSLVDAYTRGELKGNDFKRFEASLKKSPEKREKIANAIALNSLIKEEKQTVPETQKSVVSEPTLWEKIAAFFKLQMSATQFAAAALVILLLGGTGFLFYDRIRLNRELAHLQNDQKNTEELEKQERDLQNKLNEIRQREQDLQKLVNSEKGENEILNDQLEREKSERLKLQNEIDRLKNLRQNVPVQPKTSNQPPKPTIATIVLSPFLGGRGGDEGSQNKTVKLGSNIENVNVTLQLPKEAAAGLFVVKFAGRNIARNQKPSKTKSGVKFITVSIPAAQLSTEKDNIISVFGNDGGSYNFILKAQK